MPKTLKEISSKIDSLLALSSAFSATDDLEKQKEINRKMADILDAHHLIKK